jgi:hypothetical protein
MHVSPGGRNRPEPLGNTQTKLPKKCDSGGKKGPARSAARGGMRLRRTKMYFRPNGPNTPSEFPNARMAVPPHPSPRTERTGHAEPMHPARARGLPPPGAPAAHPHPLITSCGLLPYTLGASGFSASKCCFGGQMAACLPACLPAHPPGRTIVGILARDRESSKAPDGIGSWPRVLRTEFGGDPRISSGAPGTKH